jgi:hypothetical protein
MEDQREKIREYMFSIRSVEYTFSDSIRCLSIGAFYEYTLREYTFCKVSIS